uniref:Aa_trans domain-containing protein n=1 Tax=Ascaris lumbricoides TaxID=6252 RepID=A0A0M3HHU2_ASCLU
MYPQFSIVHTRHGFFSCRLPPFQLREMMGERKCYQFVMALTAVTVIYYLFGDIAYMLDE